MDNSNIPSLEGEDQAAESYFADLAKDHEVEREQRREQRRREAERRSKLTPTERRREDRSFYFKRAAVSARRVEHGIGSLWDYPSFFACYGSAAEIDARARQLGSIIDSWLQGTYAPEADLTAIEGLEFALDRLRELYRAADTAECKLRELGWELDPETGSLKEVKKVGPDGRRARGPKRSLVSEAVSHAYDTLTRREGWPEENTKALRQAIRKRFADTFHPESLTEARINSVVNAILNPRRHY